MPRYPYDDRDPPAPVVPVLVGPPGAAPSVLLAGLVDTGAGITAVPEALVRQIGLPATSQISVRGADGGVIRAIVYAAEIETVAGRDVIEVVGVGTDPLLGRDLVNHWTLLLRGPDRILELVISGAP